MIAITRFHAFKRTIVLAVLAVFAVVTIASLAVPDEHLPARVSAADIPDRVEIIGLLNKPLGELTNVLGKWQRPQRKKFNRMMFHVLEIDGKPIDREVTFTIVQPVNEWGGKRPPGPQEGDVWRLRGIESGGLLGCPRDVLREMLGGRDPNPGSHAGRFSFDTRFEYISCEPIVRPVEATPSST